MKRSLLALLLLSVLLPALAQAPTPRAKKNQQNAPEPAASSPQDDVKRDPNKYAVLSLLGDNVQLISLNAARGDTVQPGDWTAKPAGALDKAVLEALETTVKATGREITLYTTVTRSLFGDPSALIVEGKLSLPNNLGDSVRAGGAGHLLMITRSRQDAGLAAALPPRIYATLEGPGFVLDQRPAGQVGFDGQPGLPVLGAFISVRVALIDLQTLRLQRERSIAIAARLSVPREAADNPWAALAPEARVKALTNLIEAELPRAIEALVKP